MIKGSIQTSRALVLLCVLRVFLDIGRFVASKSKCPTGPRVWWRVRFEHGNIDRTFQSTCHTTRQLSTWYSTPWLVPRYLKQPTHVIKPTDLLKTSSFSYRVQSNNLNTKIRTMSVLKRNIHNDIIFLYSTFFSIRRKKDTWNLSLSEMFKMNILVKVLVSVRALRVKLKT